MLLYLLRDCSLRLCIVLIHQLCQKTTAMTGIVVVLMENNAQQKRQLVGHVQSMWARLGGRSQDTRT